MYKKVIAIKNEIKNNTIKVQHALKTLDAIAQYALQQNDMISKKLATSIIIICGVVSIWYILSVKQVFAGMNSSNGVRTYKYNSVQLRLAKDKVRILGKSGYLAYEGQVDKGYASGQGTLYDPEGNMVYLGNFEKSRFEGDGKSYYDNGALKYTGSFHNNEFDGHGLFYRAM